MGIAVLTQKSRFLLLSIVLDVFMIATGFIGAAMSSSARWIFFGLSTLSFIWVVYLLAKEMTEAVEERPETLRNLFRKLKWLTVGLWVLYPVAILASTDGLAVLGLRESLWVFLVLDVAAKIGYVAVVGNGLFGGAATDVVPESFDSS